MGIGRKTEKFTKFQNINAPQGVSLAEKIVQGTLGRFLTKFALFVVRLGVH